jgi:threonine dehydratase
VLAGKVPGRGPVVAVLGGGNIDPLLLTKTIDFGLSSAGRYLALRVLLGDRPGTLARLLGEVARLGLNVLAVEHHRTGLHLPMATVEVLLTLETRNTLHSDEILADLRAAGYDVPPH